MKSVTTLHRELLKKDYAASPLGIAEKKISKFYEDMVAKSQALPEEIAKKVYDIREANEKAQMDYIERSQRENREMVDSLLLDSFTKEIAVLEDYLNKHD